jgi:hypothetical protein
MADSDLDLYFKAMDRFQQQRQLYWTRVSAFLVVQGLLFTALSLASGPPVVLAVSLFGIAVSTVWYVVMELGDDILNGREAALQEVERSVNPRYPLVEMSTTYERSRSKTTRAIQGVSHDPELALPTLSVLAWLLVFIVSVLWLLSPIFEPVLGGSSGWLFDVFLEID